ncbi:DUF6221 family protein [Streptomyces malaysiensis]|uniref:DUF6221 family protein n=1 Tax=Streptomyces malaysiensis subsp. samsunensis TaxID=459658 RepID=A0A9X2RUS1_STRMQ|nr:DUF6221 family protein [Streptomyces samsunensis]MCQ8831746.1 DUF6221 family protein [Streptomyces samsunensis]
MNDALVEFLRARLDEDDAEARRVPPNQSPTELRAMVLREGGQPFLVVASERVMREVDAKRRLVGLHERLSGDAPFCVTCDAPSGIPGRDHGCDTIRLLALPYSDHPDYREEWRP